MRIQKYLFVIITLASILALVGCGESNYYPSASSKPSYSVSISQLASRLGLTVKNAGSPYYELTNANNRVLMFTYAGGRVYVNGASVCSVGTTTQVGGTTNISALDLYTYSLYSHYFWFSVEGLFLVSYYGLPLGKDSLLS